MQIIKSAIQDRQRLQFIYKGHIRIVEPHAYGATKKAVTFFVPTRWQVVTPLHMVKTRGIYLLSPKCKT